MHKIISTIILLFSFSLFTTAQQYTDLKPSKPTGELGLFGGISLPMGTYKGDIGRAQQGYYGGLYYSHYFKQSNWGLRLDGRFIRHSVNALDTDSASSPYVYSFPDGFSMIQQDNNPYFQHIALTIGPSYKMEFGKVHWSTYLTIGGLFQEYHEFSQQIMARNPFTSSYENVLTPYASDNNPKNPTVLAGIIGTQFTYDISHKFTVGLHVDFLRAFGDKGKYYVVENTPTKEIKFIEFTRDPQFGTTTNNVYEYFNENKTRTGAPIQSLQAGIVLAFKFGGTKQQKKATGDTQARIEVKDKITGQSMPNATVELLSADGEKITGRTDSNGIFTTAIQPKAYAVTGAFNNINTSSANIVPNDIKQQLVTKTLLYDDDRYILAGKTVHCQTGAPMANIETQLTNILTDEVFFATSDKEGNFYYRLDQNADFSIVANQDGKFSQTELISTKKMNRKKELFVTLTLGVCDIEAGAVFNIKNIHYDFDKSNIRPDAARILNNIVAIMKKNPNMEIELSSHTDVRGDAAYNMTLSQQRAEAAVNYIASKGIQKSRMKAKGYGESQPLNHCTEGINCTDAEHELNRRTEITILRE